MQILLAFAIVCSCISQISCRKKIFQRNEGYAKHEDCNFDIQNISAYESVEDFDRCAPLLLPTYARDFYLGAARRRVTYNENIKAYQRLRILPRVLRDVSKIKMEVTVLGDKIRMPIGSSPTAIQRLASPLGEIDTVRAISEAGTVMILSSYASTNMEDVARAAPKTVKWMQTYIFKDRNITIGLLRRAEASGFKAIVVTVDAPTEASTPERFSVVPNPQGVTWYYNIGVEEDDAANPELTFLDITWLKRNTRLPIIAKGILHPHDAVLAAYHGASGILVSNHGGRQLDYAPATIDVLPSIADAISKCCPGVEVYVDGGVRSGFDVFKALALGARVVFIGRPVLWGLAVAGEEGVSKVLNILKNELNETMTLAGARDVYHIERSMVGESSTCYNRLNFPKSFL